MNNPFEQIFDQLQSIKASIEALKNTEGNTPLEIIDRAELLKRLKITEPTAITWGRKGKIPEIRIGSSVRYNWHEVVKALEKKK